MTLTAGTRIGPYEVLGSIGAGGMGEVYRARDTRLDRDVALKILPETFASDPDRLMRFEREAKTLAALNHPNIAAIYGLEEGLPQADVASGFSRTIALVMELVEGEDLSARIARGAVPIDEAMPIARQIAEALEAAHAQGVVHRDLKPANIKVRPDGVVKVLDFGLAKAMEQGSGIGDQGSGGVANSPTMTSPAVTGRGVILGTSAYMAPEQARGKHVDQRTDIWAFGCVLYEMLTGRRAFPGDEITDVLAKVIEREPDWSALPTSTPPGVRAVITRCLRKDAAKRVHHIADARLDLELALAAPTDESQHQTPPRRPLSPWLAVAAALVAGIAGVGGAAVWMRPSPPRPEPKLRVDVALSSAAQVRPMVSVSPDGRWLAYRGVDARGLTNLHLRDLATNQDRVVPNRSDGFDQPAWSPSGSRLLLASPTTLRFIDVTGLTVRDREFKQLIGMSWVNEDEIIFSIDGTMHRLGVDGGAPLPLPSGVGEQRRRPQMLPDGRRYLFLRGGSSGERELCLGAVDSADATLVTRAVWFGYGRGQVLLLATPDGRFQGQRFDANAGVLVGQPTDLSDSVAGGGLGLVAAGVSEGGLIAFNASGSTLTSDLVWFERSGRRVDRVLESNPGAGIDLSRDARLGVTSVTGGDNPGVFVLDLARRLRSRLTSTPAIDAVIAPDGRWVAYAANGRLTVQGSLGGDPRTVLTAEVGGTLTLEHWSDDGKYLIATASTAGDREVLRVPVDGQDKPLLLASKLRLIDEMRLSPDGRWLSFNAALSDRDEVYVSPVPPTGERIQVSTTGGTSARWRDDGRELYYLAPDGTLMAVTIAARDGRLEPSVPTPLFKTDIAPTYNLDHYAVGPGGKTFLLRLPVASTEVPKVTLLVNWFSALPR